MNTTPWNLYTLDRVQLIKYSGRAVTACSLRCPAACSLCSSNKPRTDWLKPLLIFKSSYSKSKSFWWRQKTHKGVGKIWKWTNDFKEGEKELTWERETGEGGHQRRATWGVSMRFKPKTERRDTTGHFLTTDCKWESETVRKHEAETARKRRFDDGWRCS